ncbi:MAG: HAD family hydrolase [Fusobacterium sp.]|uniref:HAD family hydrolase n=2 Tax=Fusobacterium sp. TaxID=68766 RepID=UPI00399BCD37
MIKNIIFDLGNVLVKYSPENFLNKYVKKENQEDFIINIFKSKDWLELDRGTLSYEDAIEVFTKRVPEEKESIEKLFRENISSCISPIEENVEIMRKLKNNGYNVYILSNFHQPAFEYIRESWDFIREFNGDVVSCYYHYIKPERNIYETLLNKYNLTPSETIFIDDVDTNINGAKELGIGGIHLPDYKILSELLKKNGIEI